VCGASENKNTSSVEVFLFLRCPVEQKDSNPEGAMGKLGVPQGGNTKTEGF